MPTGGKRPRPVGIVPSPGQRLVGFTSSHVAHSPCRFRRPLDRPRTAFPTAPPLALRHASCVPLSLNYGVTCEANFRASPGGLRAGINRAGRPWRHSPTRRHARPWRWSSSRRRSKQPVTLAACTPPAEIGSHPSPNPEDKGGGFGKAWLSLPPLPQGLRDGVAHSVLLARESFDALAGRRGHQLADGVEDDLEMPVVLALQGVELACEAFDGERHTA